MNHGNGRKSEMEKTNMGKILGILLILAGVMSMCGCRVNKDYDIEKDVSLVLNQSVAEGSETTPANESILSSESIPESTEVAGASRNNGAVRKALMLVMGISLQLLGIVLLIVGTRMDLYSRVGEFHDTTREAMAATLKKDIAAFFGSLCKLIGGFSLLAGFLCLVTFFTWTGK